MRCMFLLLCLIAALTTSALVADAGTGQLTGSLTLPRMPKSLATLQDYSGKHTVLLYARHGDVGDTLQTPCHRDNAFATRTDHVGKNPVPVFAYRLSG